MIGVLAARNNLKVKNARQPVERNVFKCFKRSATQEQTDIDTHKNRDKQNEVNYQYIKMTTCKILALQNSIIFLS